MFKKVIGKIAEGLETGKCMKCGGYLDFGDDENLVVEEPIYTEKGFICPTCWHKVEPLFPNQKQRKRLF
jgi:DNA-directed RNA polymerase subunit RPC12/RpoP